MKTIQQLEEEYAAACNALTVYRSEHGFAPGARVICKYRDGPEKLGTIAPYGDDWMLSSHWSVPVMLDLGYTQPWMMSDIRLEDQSKIVKP